MSRITIGATTLQRERREFSASPAEFVIPCMPRSIDPFLTLQLAVVAENHGVADSTPVTFTHVGEPVPSCSTLAPTAGPLAGGTEVVIATPPAHLVTAVFFGGVAATDFAATGDQVFVRTPPFPVAADVGVALQRNGNSLSNCPQHFTFTP